MDDEGRIILPEGLTVEDIERLYREIRKTRPKRKVALVPVKRERIGDDDWLCKVYEFCGENEWSWSWYEACMVVRTALGTGLRVSEMTRLQCGTTAYIEDGAGRLTIQSSKAPEGKIRTVEISPELLPWWRARLEDYPHGEWFFPSSNTGGSLGADELARLWNKVCKAAGISNLGGIHGARHTFASWGLKLKRWDLYEMRRLLGHSSIMVTDEFYMHLILGKNGTPPRWPEVAVKGYIRPSFSRGGKKTYRPFKRR